LKEVYDKNPVDTLDGKVSFQVDSNQTYLITVEGITAYLKCMPDFGKDAWFLTEPFLYIFIIPFSEVFFFQIYFAEKIFEN
jgi:hypothetical protein